MNQEWRITIWGVRGAFAKTGPESQIYGGNTSCISLESGDSLIVLDAGSGIANLGQTVCEQKKYKRLDILLSHLHLDHIIGFISFSPFFSPDMDIHIYGTPGFRTPLENLMGDPYWPVGFGDFAAKTSFHEIAPGTSFQIGAIRLDTMAANHPNGGIYYRLTESKKSLCYALDCELTGTIQPELTAFFKNSDLLIWDANFTSADLRAGWGHSSWEQGLDIRSASGAGQILMTHYNRRYTDEFLLRQETAAQEQDKACLFAREGMVLTL